jgi:hypothetical protein
METLASSTSLDLNLQRTRMQVRTAGAAPPLHSALFCSCSSSFASSEVVPNQVVVLATARRVLRSATTAFIRYAHIWSECERQPHAAH